MNTVVGTYLRCPRLCNDYVTFSLRFVKKAVVGSRRRGGGVWPGEGLCPLPRIKCRERYVIMVFLAIDSDTDNDIKTSSVHQSRKPRKILDISEGSNPTPQTKLCSRQWGSSSTSGGFKPPTLRQIECCFQSILTHLFS